MKLRTLDDGTLLVEERLTTVRRGTAIGALALVAVLAFQLRERGLDPRDIAGGAAGFLVLAALAAWFTDRTFRFEPALQRVCWTERRLFGARSGEVPFADVLRVRQRLDFDTDARRPACQPILVTRGREIPLSSTTSIVATDWDGLVAAITKVLGRDLGESATPERLAASGRTVEAVALLRRNAAAEGRPLDLTAAKSEVDSLRSRAS